MWNLLLHRHHRLFINFTGFLSCEKKKHVRRPPNRMLPRKHWAKGSHQQLQVHWSLQPCNQLGTSQGFRKIQDDSGFIHKTVHLCGINGMQKLVVVVSGRILLASESMVEELQQVDNLKLLRQLRWSGRHRFPNSQHSGSVGQTASMPRHLRRLPGSDSSLRQLWYLSPRMLTRSSPHVAELVFAVSPSAWWNALHCQESPVPQWLRLSDGKPCASHVKTWRCACHLQRPNHLSLPWLQPDPLGWPSEQCLNPNDFEANPKQMAPVQSPAFHTHWRHKVHKQFLLCNIQRLSNICRILQHTNTYLEHQQWDYRHKRALEDLLRNKHNAKGVVPRMKIYGIPCMFLCTLQHHLVVSFDIEYIKYYSCFRVFSSQIQDTVVDDSECLAHHKEYAELHFPCLEELRWALAWHNGTRRIARAEKESKERRGRRGLPHNRVEAHAAKFSSRLTLQEKDLSQICIYIYYAMHGWRYAYAMHQCTWKGLGFLHFTSCLLFFNCSVMLCKPLPVLGTQSRCHASHGQQLLAWQWMSMNLWKIMKANVIAFKDEKRPTWEKDRQESRIQPPTKTVREARKCESDEIRIQPEWQNLFGMPAGWDN